MTMKEIEMESGMARANIRYYESEGLLAPVRNANKYRDYSEEDLEVLRKIKLLRSLRFSLEEIKALQSGVRELGEALERQEVKLQSEKAQIGRSQDLCRVMRDDGVGWRDLNAQHYLGLLEREGSIMPEEDVPAEARSPWRRYFARYMDLLVYSVLWDVFRALVWNANIIPYGESVGVWNQIVSLLLMLLAEPALLTLFGTTPGKWLMGLKVTGNGGKRLAFGEAWNRTWGVFMYGMGFGLPIWSLYKMWKNYRACANGECLEWEYHSMVTLKDEGAWRIAAYVGAFVLLGAVFVLTFRVSSLPENRGDITVAEFCENYNQLAKFYGYESMYYLDSEGKWVNEQDSGAVIVIGGAGNPEFLFTETDGVMTGMRFLVEMGGSDGNNGWAPSCQTEMILSILAFVGAQEENTVFSRKVEDMAKAVQEVPFESFEQSAWGVDICCKTAYSGYMEIPGLGMLMKQEGSEGWFSLEFSMMKND